MNKHCQTKNYTAQKHKTFYPPPPPPRSKCLYRNTLNICFITSFRKPLLFFFILFYTSFLVLSCVDVADDDPPLVISSALKAIVESKQIPAQSDLIMHGQEVQDALSPIAGTAAKTFSVLYVSVGGAGSKDGSTWGNAYALDNLKKAITDAGVASTTNPYLVFVASGTYAITETLNMKNNVAIIGGIGSNWSLGQATILDGGGNTQIFSNSGLNSSAVLYGVTIAKGKGLDGGGMSNYASSPSLTQVVFSANVAENNGGGMYNTEITSKPILTQVVFTANKAASNGGGMYNSNSSPTLTQVVFSTNTASDGGGMYSIGGSPSLSQIVFSTNTASKGGGMFNFGSSVTVINSIFWGNTAGTNKDQIRLEGRSDNLNIYYSIVEGATDAERFTIAANKTPTITQYGVINSNPNLADTTLNLFAGASVTIPTISAGSSAIDAGLYIQKSGSTLYYSEDATTWYTSFNTGTTVGAFTGVSPTALPSDAINLTAKDITGYARKNRPDIGAYEAR